MSTAVGEVTKPLSDEEKDRIGAGIAMMSEEKRVRLLKMLQPRMVEQYMVHIPHPKQQVFLSLKVKEAMYGGAAGGGKLLHVDEPVLTPKGWKRNGDLQDGDTLVDPRTGRSMSVVKAYDAIEQDAYVVEFEDGTEVKVGPDHLWTVRNSGKRTKTWDTRNAMGDADPWLNGYGIVTTEILKAHVDRAKKQQARGIRPNWPHTPVPREVEFTKPYRNIHASLPVDGYLLGLLIGDGSMSSTTITSVDHEIAAYLDLVATENGWVVKHDDVKHHRISKAPALRAGLMRLGLLGTKSWDKFVPEAYLFAPLSVRKRLMQGLMDTDGYVDERGHLSYTTVSKQLATDVQNLARSLGARAKVTSKVPTYSHKGQKKQGRIAYTVWITPHDPEGFVSLPRKVKRLKRSQSIPSLEVVDVRKTGKREMMRCIKVSTVDGLYITKNFAVTHNSDSLLMAALQYVDVPGYSALLLRRTWPDLSSPGAILDRAKSWLLPTDAQIREGGRVWIFPSGARITFGTILRENDKYKYQSAEYQFVGFDELTQFDESQYTYMFSRIRRPELACLNCNVAVRKQGANWKHRPGSDPSMKEAADACPHLFPDPKVISQYPASEDGISIFDVPLRMRAATNPGGRGHEWVLNRFINPKTKPELAPNAVFVPAFLTDNPSLDRDSYMENLEQLTNVERERLLNGDWDITESGDMFERHYFKVLKDAPKNVKSIRAWDNAATGNGGDWTVGAKVSLVGGRWVIEDIVRGQWTSAQKEAVVEQTAHADGPDVAVVMEQEPGSSGVDVIDHYARNVLVGYNFHGERPSGSKQDRAMPMAAAAEAGNVYLVQGPWNNKFLDEAVQFPEGLHDDQIDAVTLAMSVLSRKGRKARLLV